MRSLLLATCLLTLAASAAAELQPRTSSPAYAHLAEVNERWLHEVSPSGLLADTAYLDEAARIRHHLLAVHDVLAARDVDSLPAKQATARAAALSHLRHYAERERFPVNTAHAARPTS